MRIRPCIDLREGQVVQIVGSSLTEGAADKLIVNFKAKRPSAAYARLYRAAHLPGGHIIALGPGNQEAALSALRAFPGGMQMGGGVTPDNAATYLDAGASHVIVTSYVFSNGRVDMDRLKKLTAVVGRSRLVLDLSCRKRGADYWVVTDRWQKFTEVPVNPGTLQHLSGFCDEFLVHGVDVEGMRLGIDAELVQMLGDHSPIPTTYAGGVRALSDLERVSELGKGRIDLTIGSALNIFGGDVSFSDIVAWQQEKTDKR